MIKHFSLTFIILVILLLVLDFVWLGSTMNTLYKPNMPGMVREQPNLIAGGAFYVLYAFGLACLIVYPSLFGARRADFIALAWKAALFGLVCFATYDLTGLSVIKNWPLKLSLIDMAWGTFAATTASLGTGFVLKLLGQLR